MAETFVGVREGPGGFVQRVCIKRILTGHEGDPEMVRLFQREARVAASLTHRAITQVIDFGHEQNHDWLALELVEGTDLRHLIRSRPEPRALPAPVAVYIGLELAEGLAHAHDQRPGPVVHRDVSPANVLLGQDGSVKLTDFGLAKNVAEVGPQTKLTRGNLRYMAPEVLAGVRRDDPRSDLFALGVILYQCLAGVRPYEARTLAGAVAALMKGELIPLRRAAPHLASPLCDVVSALMAPRLGDRIPSAQAAVRALSEQTDLLAGRTGLIRALDAHHTIHKSVAIEPPAEEHETESLSLVSEPSPMPHLRHALPPRWLQYEKAPRVWRAIDPDEFRDS